MRTTFRCENNNPGKGGAIHYPKPDRSNYVPNFRKTIENDQLDIGWNEGVLSDGRPFRLEAWALDGMTSLTYFFSTLGMEKLSSRDEFADLLEREGLIRYRDPAKRSAYAREIVDGAGNPMWSLNVVIGLEDELYAEDTLPIRPWPDALRDEG